ncbi:hypothetical protein VTJ83DRAFT_5370 [Remersonia thermophila]|uniref:Uncharacterized protein n=1 Tax=Remersonia thermophila TaxID=72144 RepID=A0ABR4D6M5_9PEZI
MLIPWALAALVIARFATAAFGHDNLPGPAPLPPLSRESNQDSLSQHVRGYQQPVLQTLRHGEVAGKASGPARDPSQRREPAWRAGDSRLLARQGPPGDDDDDDSDDDDDDDDDGPGGRPRPPGGPGNRPPPPPPPPNALESTSTTTQAVTVTTTSVAGVSETTTVTVTRVQVITVNDPLARTQTATVTALSFFPVGRRAATASQQPTALSRARRKPGFAAPVATPTPPLPSGGHDARGLAEKRAEVTETLTVTATLVVTSRSLVTVTVTTTIFSTTTIAANPETTVTVTTTIASPSPSPPPTETPGAPPASDPPAFTPDPLVPVPAPPPSLTDGATEPPPPVVSTEIPLESGTVSTGAPISTVPIIPTLTPKITFPTTSPGVPTSTSTSSSVSSSSSSSSSSSLPTSSSSPTDPIPPATPLPDATIVDAPPASRRLTDGQIAGICAGVVAFLALLSLCLYLLRRRAQRRRLEAIQAKLLDQERGVGAGAGGPPRVTLSLPGEMSMVATAGAVAAGGGAGAAAGAQRLYAGLEGGNPYFPGSEERISSLGESSSSSDTSSSSSSGPESRAAGGPVVRTGPGPSGSVPARTGTAGTVSSGNSSRGRLGLAPMAVVAGWKDRAKDRLTRLRGGRRPSSSASESAYSYLTTTSSRGSSALRGDGVGAVRVVVRRPGEPPAVGTPAVGESSPASLPAGAGTGTESWREPSAGPTEEEEGPLRGLATPPPPSPPPRSAARLASIRRKPIPGSVGPATLRQAYAGTSAAATFMAPPQPLPSPLSPGVEATGGGWSTASQRGSMTDLIGDAEGGVGERERDESGSGRGRGTGRKSVSSGGRPWWAGSGSKGG